MNLDRNQSADADFEESLRASFQQLPADRQKVIMTDSVDEPIETSSLQLLREATRRAEGVSPPPSAASLQNLQAGWMAFLSAVRANSSSSADHFLGLATESLGGINDVELRESVLSEWCSSAPQFKKQLLSLMRSPIARTPWSSTHVLGMAVAIAAACIVLAVGIRFRSHIAVLKSPQNQPVVQTSHTTWVATSLVATFVAKNGDPSIVYSHGKYKFSASGNTNARFVWLILVDNVGPDIIKYVEAHEGSFDLSAEIEFDKRECTEHLVLIATDSPPTSLDGNRWLTQKSVDLLQEPVDEDVAVDVAANIVVEALLEAGVTDIQDRWAKRFRHIAATAPR